MKISSITALRGVLILFLMVCHTTYGFVIQPYGGPQTITTTIQRSNRHSVGASEKRTLLDQVSWRQTTFSGRLFAATTNQDTAKVASTIEDDIYTIPLENISLSDLPRVGGYVIRTRSLWCSTHIVPILLTTPFPCLAQKNGVIGRNDSTLVTTGSSCSRGFCR